MKKKILFVSWISYSRRSQLFAEKFNMQLYLIQILKHRYFLSPIRYILQSIVTFKTLLKERPRIIFVQNPPIFAALTVYFYTKIRKAKFIIDSHTGALIAPWWKWSLPLHAFLSRRAIATIVTNKYLEKIIKKWRANAIIISDIPKIFPEGKKYNFSNKFNIAVINTFSPDEPIDEILKAASELPEVDFYITGDTIQAKKRYLNNHPPNIKITGFLLDDQYIGLLRSAQCVLVLTKDDHTMQRGACEAVSLGKPIITSNWPLLKEYFNKGTIHVGCTGNEIKDGILKMIKNHEFFKKEILKLQKRRKIEWNENYEELTKLID